jgi:hypothetical protein
MKEPNFRGEKLRNIVYQGRLAALNKELITYRPKSNSHVVLVEKVSQLPPKDFKKDQLGWMKENLDKINAYEQNNSISKKASVLLKNFTYMKTAYYLFGYLNNRSYAVKKELDNETLKIPVQDDYYNFIKLMPLDDQSLLIDRNFGNFVNRFETCKLFNDLKEPRPKVEVKRTKKRKSFIDFLKSKEVKLSKEELNIFTQVDLTKEGQKERKVFFEKYKSQLKKYKIEHPLTVQKAKKRRKKQDVWKRKDSLIDVRFGSRNDLVQQLAKLRSFNHFHSNSKRLIDEHWEEIKKGISHPYLMKIGDDLLAGKYKRYKVIRKKLAEGDAKLIFEKMMLPFKNKYLVVTFWVNKQGVEMTEKAHMKNRENDNLEFVYITNEDYPSIQFYNKTIKDFNLKNTFRVKKDQFNYFRDLFQFCGSTGQYVIDSNGELVEYGSSFSFDLDNKLYTIFNDDKRKSQLK